MLITWRVSGYLSLQNFSASIQPPINDEGMSNQRLTTAGMKINKITFTCRHIASQRNRGILCGFIGGGTFEIGHGPEKKKLPDQNSIAFFRLSDQLPSVPPTP